MMNTENRQRIQFLNKAIEKGKERLARLKVLRDFRKTPYWVAFKGELELARDANEKQRDIVLDGNVSGEPVNVFIEAKMFHRSAATYRFMIGVVEQSEERMDRLNEEIGKARSEVKRLQGNTMAHVPTVGD